jgi:hypothetical protein
VSARAHQLWFAGCTCAQTQSRKAAFDRVGWRCEHRGQFATLTGLDPGDISSIMTNEQNVNEWVDVVTAHNRGNAGLWTARFVIEGVAAVEQAVTRVETVNATLGPNGPNQEYAVRFPPPTVREVVRILSELGGRLSSHQTLAPLV